MSIRVLLVEQNDAVEHMIRSLLSRLGYKVVAVKSIFTALEVMRSDPHEIVVISGDFLMPDGGFIAGEQIWEIAPETPIVFIVDRRKSGGVPDTFSRFPHAVVDLATNGGALIGAIQRLITRGGE